MAMPVIMEMEDGHLIPGDELTLELIDLVLQQLVNAVLMRVEGRLVSDDHIPAAGCSALDYIERRHHRSGDPLYRDVRSSCNEVVDCLGAPRDADVGLDSLNYLTCSERLKGL